MTAKLLDGKALATRIQHELKARVASLLSEKKRAPALAVILIGEDPASMIYVHNKEIACETVGIRSIKHKLPYDTSEQTLLDLIDDLNQDSHIDGILVQLPLPKHIDPNNVIMHIDPKKDPDGFHPMNVGRLLLRFPAIRPCTPLGIMRLLETTELDLHGKEAVIIGASNIVGRPLAAELLMAGCTITLCHRFTEDLASHAKRADILISAVGKPNLIKGDWIKPGAIVIDVGITRLSNGTVAGDVAFESAAERAAWITPVPGGVGPMTVAMLLHNTIEHCSGAPG